MGARPPSKKLKEVPFKFLISGLHRWYGNVGVVAKRGALTGGFTATGSIAAGHSPAKPPIAAFASYAAFNAGVAMNTKAAVTTLCRI
jgi:hypothetical protein